MCSLVCEMFGRQLVREIKITGLHVFYHQASYPKLLEVPRATRELTPVEKKKKHFPSIDLCHIC